MTVWRFLKADQFFPVYLPDIKNYKHKISGKSTKGQPLDFSEEEKKAIKKALKKFVKDHTT